MKQLESTKLYKSKIGNKTMFTLWSVIFFMLLLIFFLLTFPLSHQIPQQKDGILYLNHSKDIEIKIHSSTKIEAGQRIQLFQNGHAIAYGQITKPNHNTSFIFFTHNSIFNMNYSKQKNNQDIPTKITFLVDPSYFILIKNFLCSWNHILLGRCCYDKVLKAITCI